MLQVLMKWKVTVGDKVIWMHDNYASNILRELADLQFTEYGLEQPSLIKIELCYGGTANKVVFND